MGNTLTSPKGGPVFTNTPTQTSTDMNALRIFTEKVGNRRSDTTVARNAASGADVWEGLEWHDTTDGQDYEYISGGWKPIHVYHTQAVRRVVAADNVFSSAAYADFPQAADAAALAMTFTKRASGSNLIVAMSGRLQFDSGALSTIGSIGISIAGTDYEVANYYPAATGVRFPFAGSINIPGVAAGALAVKPRIKSLAGQSYRFYLAALDYLSYTITESD